MKGKFFMNINCIPVLGWFLSFVGNASLAIPFWLCWTCFGIGEKYFSFLPTVYKVIPFWECIWFFMCISIIGSLIKSVSPLSMSTNSTSTSK
jgi:hypothetical protein